MPPIERLKTDGLLKLRKQRNANRRTYFFNAIGHERPNQDGWATSALPPRATKSLRRIK
jgi:hypothetical protein